MTLIYTVNASSLRLRNAPVNGDIITNIPMDHEVQLTGVSSTPGWWEVKVQVGRMIETGFVAKDYLLPFDPPPAKKFRIPLLTNIKTSIGNIQKFAGDHADNLTPDLLIELNDVLKEYKINKTPLRFVHFIAQITHETGHFRTLSENLNYSAIGLQRTFSKYFPTEELAQEYERDKQRIANRVYANRMANGDESSGDGWRYRGRGYIQLTGRENYRVIGKRIGVDLENNPDIISQDPKIALQVAANYWDSRKINKEADKDDLREVTYLINGGYNGLADRERILKKAKHVWGG